MGDRCVLVSWTHHHPGESEKACFAMTQGLSNALSPELFAGFLSDK
jgi:hypothetical protein